MKIKLHQNQGTVFLSSSRFKIVAAGRRWGKTVLACTILFTEAIKNPEGIYWLCAPTFSQAKELAWSILIKMIPSQLITKKNETELSFVLDNKAEIHLKGADCDPDRLRGRGLRGLVIDEVATIRNHKSVWEEILRPSLSDYQGFCVFISTPKGKDYFWELWCKGQRKEEGYESWQFTTEDNPHIPRSEIKAAQEQLSERFFKQEYLASFEDYTGLIWPEYSEKVHVVEPFEVPTWWENLGAIDPAITGTTGALFARIDQDGVIYITGEYYEQDKRVSEVTEAIRGKVQTWVIDPAAKKAFTSREGKLYTLYDEYTEHLGNHVYFGENDVNGGINRVAEFFKAGKIKIFSSCKNLIWELERYHWADQEETVSGIPQPKPYKANDHLCVAGDSLVNTVNGDIPIRDLVGKEGYLYSYDGTRICTKKFFNVRKTGNNAPTWKIVYTDGGSIVTTSDHPFMLRSGDYKPVSELSVGDSLMPFYRRVDHYGHELIHLNNGEIRRANRLVYEDVFGPIGNDYVVHHRNGDRWNNSPENLELLTRAEHIKLHRSLGKPNFDEISERIDKTREGYRNEIKANKREDLLSRQSSVHDWRKTQKGHVWHKQHGFEVAAVQFSKEKEVIEDCLYCGRSFVSYRILRKRHFYCSGNCKSSARRKSGVDNEDRVCLSCGNIFKANKYSSSKSCSRKCAWKNRSLKYFNHKIAEIVYAGNTDVYNLCVEGTHNFACNGVITHNCDTLRYLVMARPAESKYIEKPKPGTHEFWDEYERRHRIKQGIEEEIYELDEAI